MSLVDETTGRLNILVAYPYARPEIIELFKTEQGVIRFVLDSGAFTAWKAGKPIALDDYCKFIEKLPIVPWKYFTLDVIGDPHGSLKNYEIMLKRGFAPVPIFTRGEDPSVLDDYYKHSDIVGIGGLVGTPKNKAFVNGIMRHVGARKTHWLGFTSMEFLKKYRPFMCDSSRWEMGARFASIELYMGSGKLTVIKKMDFQTRPTQQVIDRLTVLGFDPYALATNKRWYGSDSIPRMLGAASSVSMSLDVELNLGTKVFLACATKHGIDMLIKQHRCQTKGLSI
jgi:hypothetical protein